MLYTVLHAAVIALGGIAPVMLRDELRFCAVTRMHWIALDCHRNAILAVPCPPRIFDLNQRVFSGLDLVAHRERNVVLVVQPVGYLRNRPAWDNLADENNASSNLVSDLPSYIKPQIYFLEVAMKWNPYAANSCLQETKSDETDKSFAVPLVQLCSCGDAAKQQPWIDLIVQHGEHAPFCSEK